jgi:hypothetical protein
VPWQQDLINSLRHSNVEVTRTLQTAAFHGLIVSEAGDAAVANTWSHLKLGSIAPFKLTFHDTIVLTLRMQEIQPRCFIHFTQWTIDAEQAHKMLRSRLSAGV